MTRNQDLSNIFWWQPRPFLGIKCLQKQNVGDYLGPKLVSAILSAENLKIYNQTNKRLLTIGSILHFAKDKDAIWGTGLNGKVNPEQHSFSELDVRALRGPLTQEFLIEKGISIPKKIAFGDPGILTSKYFPVDAPKRTKAIYIPHMREKNPTKKLKGSGVEMLSPLLNLTDFLYKLNTAERVITTSLHGVIIAESYGIPAVMLKNNSGENILKFIDYFNGTDRDLPEISKSITGAMNQKPNTPNLQAQQKGLLSTFPYDLW
jgi:pyruvyltransferase